MTLSRTRGHCFKITVRNSRINARQHFLQSELFLLGITYQQLSLLHRQSVYLKRVAEIDLSSFLTIKLQITMYKI